MTWVKSLEKKLHINQRRREKESKKPDGNKTK